MPLTSVNPEAGGYVNGPDASGAKQPAAPTGGKVEVGSTLAVNPVGVAAGAKKPIGVGSTIYVNPVEMASGRTLPPTTNKVIDHPAIAGLFDLGPKASAKPPIKNPYLSNTTKANIR